MFAGTHEAALLALLNGSVDAVASFDLAPQQYLKDKEKVEKLTHVAETDPIPEAGMAVRDGLDPALVGKARRANGIQCPGVPAHSQGLLRH